MESYTWSISIVNVHFLNSRSVTLSHTVATKSLSFLVFPSASLFLSKALMELVLFNNALLVQIIKEDFFPQLLTFLSYNKSHI